MRHRQSSRPQRRRNRELPFLAILVAINYIGKQQNKRWDLTAAKQFSLSDQTRNVVAKLDAPLRLQGLDPTNSAAEPRAIDVAILGKGPACAPIPVARIAEIAFDQVHDAMRPAAQFRLVQLNDVVGARPVTFFQVTYRRSEWHGSPHLAISHYATKNGRASCRERVSSPV